MLVNAHIPRGSRGVGRWSVAVGLVGCWLASGVPSAFAAQTATVLATQTTGPVEPGAPQALDDAMVRALREQQLGTVGAVERDTVLKSESKLANCRSNPCLERIGRLLDSELVLQGHGTATRSPSTEPAAALDWELGVDLFDVQVGAQGASLRSSCRACTLPRAAQALADLTQQAVLETAARPRGLLVVSSKPHSALVFVDGTELGITPYKRATFAGKHRLVVRSTGFRSYQSEFVLADSQRESVTVTLQLGEEAAPGSSGEKSTTPIYKKWWFWALLGGAAAAAGGITAGVLLGTREVVPNGAPGAFHIHF